MFTIRKLTLLIGKLDKDISSLNICRLLDFKRLKEGWNKKNSFT